jgi:isocitrate dehydrogenase
MSKGTINYTITDEAPYLATQSFLPIVEAMCDTSGINVVKKDISLAGRILANFSENLTEEQKVPDALTELGELAKTPQANIMKLPNISASVPQLKAAIKELQDKGFAVPSYPEEPSNSEEENLKKRYAKVLGSAVNPVLREGNSDRRVAKAVKTYAQNNPHSMGDWDAVSVSHVASMPEGDFFGSEKSRTMTKADTVKIVLKTSEGEKVLKQGLELLEGEVIDASRMSYKALTKFLQGEVKDAKKKGLLFSLHMKATMMKVSDPIIFGRAVEVFFADVFEKHKATFEEIGVNSRNGFGDVEAKIAQLPDGKQSEIREDIKACLAQGPAIAMVNSDKGITNLHVPSDVIIDASMPAAIRSGGKMWSADGKLQDMKAVIPDRSYSAVYQKVIEFCKMNGAFDPSTMGSVANVGLMAKKAEEYGSHDKTFWLEEAGEVQVVDSSGAVLLAHNVEPKDIWRMCQTQDVAVRDWVKLAVTRARATGAPAVFWLDRERAHDAELIKKVEPELEKLDTAGLDIKILSPAEATQYSLERIQKGEDTISVTGNVLRDYLTDLFPILELGTSAKMLSIVPLLEGGSLFETGAGGSAPKHVEQLMSENHLRWDSLGEFLALAVSLDDLADKTNNPKAKVLAAALDIANEKYLLNDKAPSRKVGELDNRGTHFYVFLYWAQALATQSEDSELQQKFQGIAAKLESCEAQVIEELNSVQGKAADIGGYYKPDEETVAKVMRPSSTLNSIIAEVTA